ncbi:MAG: alkaline phosphatase family protein [Planctomycetota bacterium]
MSKPTRTLLIGWDAADWRFAQPLIDQGAMPALKSVVDNGASGNLATLRPMLSPMLWNSIATGKRASKHGVHGFCEVTPDGRGVRPVRSTTRTCKALWNIASQSGLRSNVVGWYASHPTEPVAGAVVSDQFAKATAHPDEPWPVANGAVHPSELLETLAALRVHPMELGREDVVPFMPCLAAGALPDDSPLLNPTKHRKLGKLMELVAETATTHAAATWLMAHTEWDFMAVYYEGIDRFAHAFMEFHPPRMDHVDAETFERYRHVMSICYQYHDMMLAATLRLVGPSTNVVLLSDHGYHFDALRPAGSAARTDPVGWHHPLGMIAMRGPDVLEGQSILGATLLDVAPTVLSLLGLPYGLDMDGKPLLSALQPEVKTDYVVSWDLLDGEDGRLPPEAKSDPGQESEALRQLVELGYLDPLDEDATTRTCRVRQINQLALLESLMEEGDLAAADDLAEQMLQDDFMLVPALHVRFGCALHREQYEVAAEWLKQLEAAGMSEPSLSYERSRWLAAAGRPADARDALSAIDADRLTASERLAYAVRQGTVMLAVDEPDEAQRWFDEALRLDPNHVYAHDGLAQVAQRQKRHSVVVEHCLAALERMYFLPRAHYKLGCALEALGQTESAIQAWQVAILQAPNWSAPREALDRVLREQGRDDQAIAEWVHRRSAMDRMVADRVRPVETSVSQDTPIGRSERSDSLAAGRGNSIHVVAGLPRSGTSLMMQLLEAAGVAAFTDHHRGRDENNPRGYFEHEMIRRLPSDPSVVRNASGHAVKVIHALVEYLPAGFFYKMIWMHRDMDEVLASQQRMLERNAGKDASRRDPEVLRRVYEQQSQRALNLCRRRADIHLLEVSHRELVDGKPEIFESLAQWLGSNVAPSRLANVIDPKLYRQKSKP